MLRSPYGAAASQEQPGPQPSDPSQRTLQAVAATAKPGLAKAALPGAPEAHSNGPAPTGSAKDVEESAAEQRAAGILPQDGGVAQPAQPQQKQSPFAGVAGRLSGDSVSCLRLLQILKWQTAVSVVETADAGKSAFPVAGCTVHEPATSFQCQSCDSCPLPTTIVNTLRCCLARRRW